MRLPREISMNLASAGTLAVVALVGYVLGSIPSGFLIVKALTGQDIRAVGSGRTGGTNAYRAAGRWAFLLTGLADIAKAAVAVLLVRAVLNDRVAEVVAGFCAIAGHNWSMFLRFHGGAGVGTAGGAVLATMPALLFLVLPIFIVVFARTRYASLASITTLLAAIPVSLLMYGLGFAPIEYTVFTMAVCLMIIAIHHGNIRRLLAGTERRIEIK